MTQPHIDQSALRLEYQLTESEISKARGVVLREQVGGGSQWVALIVLIGICVALLATFYFATPARFRNYVVAFGVAIFPISYVMTRYQNRKAAAQGLTSIQISDKELCVSSSNSSSQLRMGWETVGKVVQDGELFIIIGQNKAIAFPIPTRAFPNKECEQWFRQVADIRLAGEPASKPPAPAPEPSKGDGVVLEFRYGPLDFFDMALTSWFTRFMMIGAAIIPIVGLIMFLRSPQQEGERHYLLLFAIMPVFMALMAAAALVAAVWHAWSHGVRIAQRYLVTEAGITGEIKGISASQAWQGFTYWRETRRSFFLWQGYRSVALIVPKRAFADTAQLHWFRNLLVSHLKQSHWYFG